MIREEEESRRSLEAAERRKIRDERMEERSRRRGGDAFPDGSLLQDGEESDPEPILEEVNLDSDLKMEPGETLCEEVVTEDSAVPSSDQVLPPAAQPGPVRRSE